MASTRTRAAPTTHCGTCGFSGLLRGQWLPGLPGLCGVGGRGGREEDWAGPSGCWLVPGPSSRAALTSGLELYEKRHRASWPISS